MKSKDRSLPNLQFRAAPVSGAGVLGFLNALQNPPGVPVEIHRPLVQSADRHRHRATHGSSLPGLFGETGG